MIVFDIETGPLPDEVLLERSKPFEPPAPPDSGDFDPKSVKLGNLKDEAKIAAKIEKARNDHEGAAAKYKSDLQAAKAGWWKSVKERAALSAVTGEVLAIGYQSTDTGKTILDIKDEAGMLAAFWHQYSRCKSHNRLLVGHNIFGFDIPFIVRRTWMLGMEVPPDVFERRRFLNNRTFADTMILWSCGNGKAMISLNDAAKAIGIPGKTEGVDGSMFAELLTTDRPRAEEYLTDDLRITAAFATSMGLF